VGGATAPSALPEPGHTKPGLLDGRPRGLMVYAAALLFAAAGNGAAFWQVDRTILRFQGQGMLIVLAVGFASTALACAHYTGIAIRQRKNGLKFSAWVIAAAALAWVGVGILTFWAQHYAATSDCVLLGPPPISCVALSASGALLSGDIFAGVYFAAGVVTVIGAYLTEEDARNSRLTRALRRASQEVRHPYRLSARRITGFAARVAGSERMGAHEEWYAHLASQESRWHGYKMAGGFLFAALRFRLADATDTAWTPVDAILKSRTLSNLLVLGLSSVAAIDVGQHEGRLGVVLGAESLIGIGGLVYGLIRVGRWYRDVKPPEPKARRIKNGGSG
jgi:hypothetical protein